MPRGELKLVATDENNGNLEFHDNEKVTFDIDVDLKNWTSVIISYN